jgi:ABC-2 type transport system permease protein
VASKEVRQLARDRLTFAMVIGIPLILILLFGFAINLDVRHLRAGVVDEAGTQAARWLVSGLQASQVVDIVYRSSSVTELENAMRRNEIVVGIHIPHDFERRRLDPSRPAAQLLVDGTDPLLVGIVSSVLDMPLQTRNLSAPRSAQSLFFLRPFYNPEQRSAVMIVPGLIGVILTFTMVLFTSVAIVRERERGNLELLITTPVRTPELMIGKILPYIVIGLIQVTLILAVGVILFDVPIHGQLLDLYLASAVYIAATLGFGLLISTIAKIQFQAFQLTFFIMMPSILLSGFVFPFDGMPIAAQYIAQALPLTHFVVLIRGIVLKGAELHEMLAPLRNLGILFAVSMTLALLRFRKRLD